MIDRKYFKTDKAFDGQNQCHPKLIEVMRYIAQVTEQVGGECIFTETKTNIASFIAGYFDADGHNPKIKTYKTITSISKEFLNDIQTLLLQLGVFCSVVLYREAIGNWKPLYKLTVPRLS